MPTISHEDQALLDKAKANQAKRSELMKQINASRTKSTYSLNARKAWAKRKAKLL